MLPFMNHNNSFPMFFPMPGGPGGGGNGMYDAKNEGSCSSGGCGCSDEGGGGMCSGLIWVQYDDNPYSATAKPVLCLGMAPVGP